MVHSKGLVVVLKVDGKVLTESHETVNVPFDSEYSIYIKNLKPNQKALVDVFVDGQIAIKGLIVPAGGSADLERFHDGRNEKGRKFMFVEKDAAVEARRDNQVEDGLIRIEYRFERYETPSWSFEPMSFGGTDFNGNLLRGLGTGSPHNNYTITTNAFSCNVKSCANDAGITERGSISDQKFITGYIGALESEKHVMVLGMKGFHKEGKPHPWVVASTTSAVTARPKWKAPKERFCTNCGNKPRKNDKFCGNCGKNLN